MTFTSDLAGSSAINRLFDNLPDLAGIWSMLRLLGLPLLAEV